MTLRIRVATRKSPLALAQTRAWVAELRAARPDLSLEIEEMHVTTAGDRIQDRALREVGGKKLFIEEIEQVLLRGEADVAVHSMKDVPADIAPGLVIGAVPEREDPRDVIVTTTGCSFAELPARARVGTSSLRRSLQLREWRADIEVVMLRGNVDTRLAKCERGEVDAAVLARAGLNRLGIEVHSESIDVERILPAIGQGALAIEHRAGDPVGEIIRALAHVETSLAVAAERGLQGAVEGSCDVPVGGYAMKDGEHLWLRGLLADRDGGNPRRRDVRIPWPESDDEARRAGVELGRALR